MSNPNEDLFNLNMSEAAKPLYEAVKKHIADNCDPYTEEYYALDKGKEDRWQFHPRQLEIIAIDLFETTNATAKVRLSEEGKPTFYSFYALVKSKGQWLITSDLVMMK